MNTVQSAPEFSLEIDSYYKICYTLTNTAFDCTLYCICLSTQAFILQLPLSLALYSYQDDFYAKMYNYIYKLSA